MNLAMNEEQICAMVDTYGGVLYKFCLRLTGNKTDADDLFQDTFIKLVEQSVTVDDTRNPRALLVSIAFRLWQSSRRKYARRMRLAPSTSFEEARLAGDGGDMDAEIIAGEDCAQVRSLVAALEERYRLPLYMYYTAELNMEEIGKALGIPPGTVKSRLHKARQILRQRWEAAGYE